MPQTAADHSAVQASPAFTITFVTQVSEWCRHLTPSHHLVSSHPHLTATFSTQVAFAFVPGAVVVFIVRERERHHNSKHQQVTSGPNHHPLISSSHPLLSSSHPLIIASPHHHHEVISGTNILAYWLGNYCFDMTMYLATMALTLIGFKGFRMDPFVDHGAPSRRRRRHHRHHHRHHRHHHLVPTSRLLVASRRARSDGAPLLRLRARHHLRHLLPQLPLRQPYACVRRRCHRCWLSQPPLPAESATAAC
jgi:hypothetical protein